MDIILNNAPSVKTVSPKHTAKHTAEHTAAPAPGYRDGEWGQL